jgi:opacity protein-like surface antigen
MRRHLVLAVLAATVTATAAAAAAAPALTGYGATRKAWYAHHKLDKSPVLLAGCCFGPRQNDGQDRYYNVQYSLNRVMMYDMDFGPRLSAKDARRQVAKELPRDARLVAHKKRGHCEQFLYKSAAARRAVGKAFVGAEFASDATGGSYDGKVKKITIGSLVTTHAACGIG